MRAPGHACPDTAIRSLIRRARQLCSAVLTAGSIGQLAADVPVAFEFSLAPLDPGLHWATSSGYSYDGDLAGNECSGHGKHAGMALHTAMSEPANAGTQENGYYPSFFIILRVSDNSNSASDGYIDSANLARASVRMIPITLPKLAATFSSKLLAK